MKKNTTTVLLVLIAVVALIIPIIAAGAQGQAAGQAPAAAAPQGGRGGGGRGGAAGGNPNPPTSPVSGNAANGKALYYNHSCYGCHGFNGETGRAFVGNWTSNLASEENFIRFLRARANVAPLTPSTSMPNFPENSLSDRQAKDIYAYIRTFKSNAPPLQNIQTLNEIVKAASRPYKP